MDRNEFESEISTGDRDEYVSEDALKFFRDTASIRVIERSALEKGDIDQTSFITITTPTKLEKTDDELIQEVKEKIGDGMRDAQKYDLRHQGNSPTVIEIWKHKRGYSAFALAE